MVFKLFILDSGMFQEIDLTHPTLWKGKALVAMAVIAVGGVAWQMGMSYHSLIGGSGVVLVIYSYALFLLGVMTGRRIRADDHDR